MTTNAWVIDENEAILPPIDSVDAGLTINSVANQPTVPLGTIVRAKHATLGEGEFIYLRGVSGTAAGLVVTYTSSTGLTGLAPNTANLAKPVAVAMAACTSPTTTFGWYQVSGSATVLKTAVKVDPATATKVTISATSGRVMQTSAAGKVILGAVFDTATTVTSTTSTAVVTLSRPTFTAV